MTLMDFYFFQFGFTGSFVGRGITVMDKEMCQQCMTETLCMSPNRAGCKVKYKNI